MSFPHHGSERNPAEEAAMKRLLEQFEGRAKREYSAGRANGEDDGDLAFGIASDPQKKLVIIRFGKPVEWIGLRAEDCVSLAEKLMEHARKIADKPLVMKL